MSQIGKILFPVDFSERSIAAAPHVSGWGKCFSADVTALHVVDPANYFACPDPDDLRMSKQLATAYAQRVGDLDYFCSQYLSNGCRVHNLVSAGSTTEVIAATAEFERAGILMLPRKHQTLGSRLLHDSLTAKILNMCPTPVWTSEKLNLLPAIPLRQIVCAVHVAEDLLLDAANKRLLDVARIVAHGFDAAVTGLYVTESAPAEHIPGIEKRLKNIRREMQDLGQFETGSGGIRRAIVEVANRKNADLIILGRTRLGTPGLGLQPHILQVDHDASCGN